ncbi:MAG TPA: MlaA family lipoprotein [Candidatus Azoamicus sp. MARI]
MKYCLFTFIFFFILFFNSDIFNVNSLDVLNRRVYSFNRGIDKVFLNPCAEIYINVLPNSVSSRINNFFYNICDIQNLFLNLFFFKFEDIDKFFSKVLINSTFGLLGLINLSSNLDLNVKSISFFGMNFFPFIFSKKYIMLPIVGPGFIMYNINLLFFQILNPFFYIFTDVSFFYFFDLIIKKSSVYFDCNFFHSNVLDGYSFLKHVYFQRFYIIVLKY